MTKKEEQEKIKEYLNEFLVNKNYCIESSWMGHIYSITPNKKKKVVQEYEMKYFLEETISKISMTKEYFEFMHFLRIKNYELVYPFIQNKIPMLDKYGNGKEEVMSFYGVLKHNRSDMLKVTCKNKVVENLLENNLTKEILDLLEKKDDKKILLQSIFKTKGFQANIDKQKKIYAYCKEINVFKEFENIFTLLKANGDKEKVIIIDDKQLYSTIIKVDINKILANNLDNDLNKNNYKNIFESLSKRMSESKELQIQYHSFEANDVVQAVFMSYNPDVKLIDKAFEIVNEEINKNKFNKDNMGYGVNTLSEDYFNKLFEKAKIQFFYDKVNTGLVEDNESITVVKNTRNKI